MKLEIPGGEFAGYIFDLDGTLVDSMPLHFRAWDLAMQRAGLPHPLGEDLFYSYAGVPTLSVAELLCLHYGLKADTEQIFHDKELLFAEMQPEIKLIEPVVEFARCVAEKAPVSVASGGPRLVVRETLRQMGLTALFPVVVTPEDVAKGKPSPDMFLLAALRMGVAPEKCLVFEDGVPGFQAAAAAGMKWVVVPSRVVG